MRGESFATKLVLYAVSLTFVVSLFGLLIDGYGCFLLSNSTWFNSSAGVTLFCLLLCEACMLLVINLVCFALIAFSGATNPLIFDIEDSFKPCGKNDRRHRRHNRRRIRRQSSNASSTNTLRTTISHSSSETSRIEGTLQWSSRVAPMASPPIDASKILSKIAQNPNRTESQAVYPILGFDENNSKFYVYHNSLKSTCSRDSAKSTSTTTSYLSKTSSSPLSNQSFSENYFSDDDLLDERVILE